MKNSLKKRIVIIGDDGSGKTTAIKTFLEQIKMNPDEQINHLEVQSVKTNDPTNSANAKRNDTKSKEESSGSSDSSEESDQVTTQVKNEIDSKLLFGTLVIDNNTYELEIWDGESEDAFKDHRRLIYRRANVVLLFFAVDTKQSLDNLNTKWKSELKTMNKKAPVILVGNKIDLRTNDSITTEQAKELAVKIGAKKYIECSAITNEGIKTIFETAIKPIDKKKCSIS